ncbi:MAG: hypothetical protein OJJ21_22235 [Ferrovibrio sp.]|uniref:DUF6634 family protein n=1 Tax=Ferrovibrio sp. TaxID=1917215 RepID=UPI00261B3C50|nr:DUF6634 family protein [Ferrovibrio sp.]MCW0236333.1 hypothetical protein [Ferrovibrio sp.]
MYRFSKDGLNRPVEDDVRKLRALADDLERLAQDQQPTRTDLHRAPSLSNYWVDLRPMYCLKGRIAGHPRIEGPTATTSDLWVFAPELGWARTYSRWYQLLGNPHADRSPPGFSIDTGGL